MARRDVGGRWPASSYRGDDPGFLTHILSDVCIVCMSELLGTFEQVVLLAIVKLGDQAYGRAILRGVQTGLQRDVVAGAIYATLERMEQKQLLSSQLDTGTSIRGGRARRYYRLTASGISALNDSRSALDRMWQGASWPLGRPV